MTVSWVCGVCGTNVNGDAYDPWCETCGDDVISVPATHYHPEPITKHQVIAICQHFSRYGEVNKQRRMRRLSKFTGRDVGDYWDLTQAEAANLLKEWAHGARA